MKNLFIMHTQYNLILSAAVMSRYPHAENTLVLYAEFTLSDELRQTLCRLFDRVIVVHDRYCRIKQPLKEIQQIRRDMKKVKCLRQERFDHIFMSQERIFDLILCARAKRDNPAARCYAVEEDAYYSINEHFNDDNFVYTLSSRAKRRRWLYALLLTGYPYNYRDVHYCYGMSSEYDGVCLLYPSCARRELADKELSPIQQDELIAGIRSLYGNEKTSVQKSGKYTLFFFDLMSRYKDSEQIKSTVQEIIRLSQEVGRTVVFKYHPRETDKFENVEGSIELPHIVPAEKVLLDFSGTDTVVIGNATTACWVAAKLGFRVVSICKIQFPTNRKMHTAMQQMGIVCIDDAREIHNLL